jgi:hypothetical protein
MTMNTDRIHAIAAELRAERLAKIETDPRYAHADQDPSVVLAKQTAIQRVEAEIGNAVDLAIRGNW